MDKQFSHQHSEFCHTIFQKHPKTKHYLCYHMMNKNYFHHGTTSSATVGTPVQILQYVNFVKLYATCVHVSVHNSKIQ